MHQHGDLAALWQAALRVGAEALDEAEDVVPAAAVEATDVVPQLMEDLVHLEGGGDGLDEHGATDAAVGEAQALLGVAEDVVPQPGLPMAFQLGDVEVGAAAAGQQFLGVMEEVEAKVEEGAGHGLAIDLDMLLRQGPAAGADDEGGQLVVELIVLALGAPEGQGAADGRGKVLLTFQGGAPGGAVGVLEVGHEAPGAGVEGVDDHLAVHRAGDLHPAVLKIGGGGAHPPVAGADLGGFGQEVQGFTGIQARLTGGAGGEQFPTARAEPLLQVHHEVQGLGGQDGRKGRGDGGEKLDLGHERLLWIRVGICCCQVRWTPVLCSATKWCKTMSL